MLHSWYASHVRTGFRGQMLVAYVHEPSLLTIVCHGKTIKSTWSEFQLRLPRLLRRHGFDPAFVELETAFANDYVVSKTSNRSVLGNMVGMIDQMQYTCTRFARYEDIELDLLEEYMMDWMYPNPRKKPVYTAAREYWKGQMGK